MRDLLLTGRSFNATKAQQVGLVSQVVGEGRGAARGARDGGADWESLIARTAIAAKQFIKPIPYDELRQEIDIFCELFAQAGGGGRAEEVCREHGRAAVFAVRVPKSIRCNDSTQDKTLDEDPESGGRALQSAAREA